MIDLWTMTKFETGKKNKTLKKVQKGTLKKKKGTLKKVDSPLKKEAVESQRQGH